LEGNNSMETGEPKSGKPPLADILAIERTHLANERTLLAYLRSVLFGVVTALTLLKFFYDDHALRIAAFAIGPLSLLIGGFGLVRFLKIRKKLSTLNPPL
jgi:putative membrane protein